MFFEENRNDIHWESFQTYPYYKNCERKKKNSVWGFISNASTALLGSLSSLSFIFEEVKYLSTISDISAIIMNYVLIIISIILSILTWIITKHSSTNHDNKMFEIIDKYKSELENGHTPEEYRKPYKK